MQRLDPAGLRLAIRLCTVGGAFAVLIRRGPTTNTSPLKCTSKHCFCICMQQACAGTNVNSLSCSRAGGLWLHMAVYAQLCYGACPAQSSCVPHRPRVMIYWHLEDTTSAQGTLCTSTHVTCPNLCQRLPSASSVPSSPLPAAAAPVSEAAVAVEFLAST